MQAYLRHQGIVLPLERSNVDTDAIIPKQYLKSIERTGFGVNLFDDWRYLDPGEPGQDPAARRPNPDFILNDARFQGASILLAGDNFGCGSSREHAVWALTDYGIRVVIAGGFADIFFSNAVRNGLLPASVDAATLAALFAWAAAHPGGALLVDLEGQDIRPVTAAPAGPAAMGPWPFTIDAAARRRLLEGLDDIALTLQYADRIRGYERYRSETHPWEFSEDRR